MYYNMPVTISKQEDGLWRAEASAFQGCFVDAGSLEESLTAVQRGIAMYIDLAVREGRPLPEGLTGRDDLPITLDVLVAPSEQPIRGSSRRASVTA